MVKGAQEKPKSEKKSEIQIVSKNPQNGSESSFRVVQIDLGQIFFFLVQIGYPKSCLFGPATQIKPEKTMLGLFGWVIQIDLDRISILLFRSGWVSDMVLKILNPNNMIRINHYPT
ncbi:hypothetical protein R6Q59_011796 [Mikania micrantha]